MINYKKKIQIPLSNLQNNSNPQSPFVSKTVGHQSKSVDLATWINHALTKGWVDINNAAGETKLSLTHPSGNTSSIFIQDATLLGGEGIFMADVNPAMTEFASLSISLDQDGGGTKNASIGYNNLATGVQNGFFTSDTSVGWRSSTPTQINIGALTPTTFGWGIAVTGDNDWNFSASSSTWEINLELDSTGEKNGISCSATESNFGYDINDDNSTKARFRAIADEVHFDAPYTVKEQANLYANTAAAAADSNLPSGAYFEVDNGDGTAAVHRKD